MPQNKNNTHRMNPVLAECHKEFVDLLLKMKANGICINIDQEVASRDDEAPVVETRISIHDKGVKQWIEIISIREGRDDNDALIDAHFASGDYFALGALSNYLWSPDLQRLDMTLAELLKGNTELIEAIEEQGYEPLY